MRFRVAESESRTYVIWRDRSCIGRRDFNKPQKCSKWNILYLFLMYLYIPLHERNCLSLNSVGDWSTPDSLLVKPVFSS